ncbi:MAG: TPM domain-containing protein [Hyphomonadaceae bacterium]|nr:TPM domain-containing protein [Hyphomonadaceae bacterium]
MALFAAAAFAAPTFPPLNGRRVVDEANVLSPQAETLLTNRLAALEANSQRQLVVVTVPSLQGYEIEDYGYQLGRAWGIGRAAQDDGVLLVVAPNDRSVRIEVGYGLEGVLTDALSSVILNARVLPKFKAGDIEGGVIDGADALIEQLSLPPEEAARRLAAASERPPEIDVEAIIFTIFLILWFLSVFTNVFGRRRRRNSPWYSGPVITSGGGRRSSGGGGFSGGGFSGGGGSFGGGGASGRW